MFYNLINTSVFLSSKRLQYPIIQAIFITNFAPNGLLRQLLPARPWHLITSLLICCFLRTSTMMFWLNTGVQNAMRVRFAKPFAETCFYEQQPTPADYTTHTYAFAVNLITLMERNEKFLFCDTFFSRLRLETQVCI